MIKHRVSLVLVSTLLLSFIVAPSQAFFGLGKCSNVKNQIKAWEKIEKPLINDWNQYSGRSTWEFSVNQQQGIAKKWIKIVNLEVKMYGLQKNNPKCFSITQREYTNQGYKSWKTSQKFNKFARTDQVGTRNGVYTTVAWDSIYNQ